MPRKRGPKAKPIEPYMWVCRNAGPKIRVPGKVQPRSCVVVRDPFKKEARDART
jgi:hypothetical protein